MFSNFFLGLKIQLSIFVVIKWAKIWQVVFILGVTKSEDSFSWLKVQFYSDAAFLLFVVISHRNIIEDPAQIRYSPQILLHSTNNTRSISILAQRSLLCCPTSMLAATPPLDYSLTARLIPKTSFSNPILPRIFRTIRWMFVIFAAVDWPLRWRTIHCRPFAF